MKTMLTWLTYGLVGTIVVVLASYLILIAAVLTRANRNLTQLVGGLEASRDHTAPLGDDLAAINMAAVALRDRLMAVDEHLSGVIRLIRG